MSPFLSLAAAALSLLSAPRTTLNDFDPQASVRYAKLFQEAREKIDAGNRNLAVNDLKELSRINAQDGSVQLFLGQALLAAKDYDGAIAALGKALELGAFQNKARAACLYDTACAYALKGEPKTAFDLLQKAMRAGFRDLAHVRTDPDLVSLHEDKRWEELAATKDVSKMSRDEAWRYDLWLLDREMRRIHYNPYRAHTATELDAFVKNLHAKIPSLTDAQIYLGFMKYAVLMGDGHTSASLPADSPLRRALPIQLFWFEEGIFVTAASPEHADLAGAQVLRVDGRTVEELLPLHEPAIWRDNPQGVRAIFPARLAIPAVGHALGVGKSPDEATLTIKDAKEAVREVTLRVVAGGPGADWATARKESKSPDPLYLKNRAKAYYFEVLPELKAVYLQYNAVRSDPADPLPAFCKRLFEAVDAPEIENLIVDVRWNGGGNSFLNRSIQDGVLSRPKVNRKGHLFLITGRNTFSAAQNFTTDLERNANPILVGEPTGSSPNFVGETVLLTLPHSRTRVSISDLYWQRSWPMDGRIWLAPQLPAPPIFGLYRENRDPAMEAVGAYLKAG